MTHSDILFRSQEARLYFKAGKNRDGYFDAEDMYVQVEVAIDLFEDNFPGTAIGAFGFDNAPSHQKRPSDGLSAWAIPKSRKHWDNRGKGKMQPG